MQHHHEQTAYVAYMIAQEMGLKDEELFLVLNAALLHDIGDVVGADASSGTQGVYGNTDDQTAEWHEAEVKADHPAEWHEAETKEERQRIARIGANMLRDIDGFQTVADIIEMNQDSYSDHPDLPDDCFAHDTPAVDEENGRMEKIKLWTAQLIHLADFVASALNTDEPVLNQVKQIMTYVEEANGTEFCPIAVEAFRRIAARECMWMDLSLNPTYMLSRLGPIREVPLDKLVLFTSLISRVIDFRSPFTAMHSAGVAASARELARLSGMTDEEVMMMEVAGNLHDIGKLRVPNSILDKPGKLIDEEFNVMKEHTYYTNMILQDVAGFEKITHWAAYHHEKLNGREYPFHLGYDGLDQGSRIMAVADIFSAITEVRPYRAGMNKEEAQRVLTENAERGEICSVVVNLLMDHYEEVDAAREQRSREVGKRYYESLGLEEPAGI